MIEGLSGFMTAPEMKARVQELTGYEHSGFDTFADALGRLDPITGARTNDRPTLVTMLILRSIGAEVAAAVLAREAFLDDGERLVFSGVDLTATPTDDELAALVLRLFGEWFGFEAQVDEIAALRVAYRVGGYAGFLGLLLQNAALYYF